MDQPLPRRRQVVTPDQFTGTYTPVYLGNALHYFVSQDPVTAIQGAPVVALMDSLPLLRQSLRDAKLN